MVTVPPPEAGCEDELQPVANPAPRITALMPIAADLFWNDCLQE
jgi:hypothetical protein